MYVLFPVGLLLASSPLSVAGWGAACASGDVLFCDTAGRSKSQHPILMIPPVSWANPLHTLVTCVSCCLFLFVPGSKARVE